jgi:hypothetical protein
MTRSFHGGTCYWVALFLIYTDLAPIFLGPSNLIAFQKKQLSGFKSELKLHASLDMFLPVKKHPLSVIR